MQINALHSWEVSWEFAQPFDFSCPAIPASKSVGVCEAHSHRYAEASHLSGQKAKFPEPIAFILNRSLPPQAGILQPSYNLIALRDACGFICPIQWRSYP
jgi:hypothetical protein